MKSTSEPVVIVAAKRTPMGAFQGQFKSLSSPQLAAAAIAAAVEQSEVNGEDFSEAILGCVLPAGVGQAPARQAVLAAGLPTSLPCTTINKVCGSGMKAVMLAHDCLAGEVRKFCLRLASHHSCDRESS